MEELGGNYYFSNLKNKNYWIDQKERRKVKNQTEQYAIFLCDYSMKKVYKKFKN